MHKPFPVVGPFVFSTTENLPLQMEIDWTGEEFPRKQTVSMAHPLSTVWPIIDHHVDNAAPFQISGL